MKADADAVAQQKQSVEQTAVQMTQDVQAASDSAQKAAASATAAQTSAQSAQQQANAAQEANAQAQQKVNSFSGYAKEKIDNGFSNALIGEATGQTVTLDDVQPNTNVRSLLVTGQTIETGTGDKSPDNPYALSVTTKITFGTETATHDYSLPQTLYNLPDGTADSGIKRRNLYR